MEIEQPKTLQEDLRPILWLSAGFAVLKLAIQIVGNVLAQHAGYGIFRDELYYLVCGRRLAFGYVDQPPMVALQARVSEMLFGHGTMWSLRLFSATAGAAKVFLTGVLCWALGGGRRAAALAMMGVIAGGVYLGIDGYLSMNSFDPVFWMLCALALARIVQNTSPNEVRSWWIVFGLSAGLAFENKDSIAFFPDCDAGCAAAYSAAQDPCQSLVCHFGISYHSGRSAEFSLADAQSLSYAGVAA